MFLGSGTCTIACYLVYTNPRYQSCDLNIPQNPIENSPLAFLMWMLYFCSCFEYIYKIVASIPHHCYHLVECHQCSI